LKGWGQIGVEKVQGVEIVEPHSLSAEDKSPISPFPPPEGGAIAYGFTAKDAVIPDKPGASRAQIRDRRKL